MRSNNLQSVQYNFTQKQNFHGISRHMKTLKHTAAPSAFNEAQPGAHQGARSDAKPVRRPYLWLLVLPFVWQVGMVPVVNSITLAPLGIPFPMVWQMLGIVFSSLIFALVFHLDRAAGLEDEEATYAELDTAGSEREMP